MAPDWGVGRFFAPPSRATPYVLELRSSHPRADDLVREARAFLSLVERLVG